MIQELIKTTPLSAVMAAPAITVHERDKFHVVHDKFVVYDIRHLPVVDDSGRVTGIISQRQLFKVHSPRLLESGEYYYDQELLDGFILKHVMEKAPYCLRPDDTLYSALNAMADFKFGCVTIVDEVKRPLGVLTRDTIIKFFLKQP